MHAPVRFSRPLLVLTIGVPLAWAVLLWFHPDVDPNHVYADLREDVVAYQIVHVGTLVFIGLMGLALYLLVRDLPVLVRADLGRSVRRVPNGPVAHAAKPSLRIDPAEPSVAYRLHLRPLREAEFRPGASGPGLLWVPAEGGEEVVIAAPQLPSPSPKWKPAPSQ